MNNKATQSKGPNLTDILLYLLGRWPWYVLALGICLTFAWYRSATAPLVYYAQTKVIIKDPSNKTSTGGLDRYDNSINRVNVTNEIHAVPLQAAAAGGGGPHARRHSLRDATRPA